MATVGSSIAFEVDADGRDGPVVTPHVDGVSLVDLVTAYERSAGFDVVGGYDGGVGCWPLEARVVVADGQVRWTGIGQPHRPERDYATFGPFVFDEVAYRAAVARAVAAAALTPRG